MDWIEYPVIEKLDGSNYNQCISDVKVILLEKNCCDTVQGSDLKTDEGFLAKEEEDSYLQYHLFNTEKSHLPLVANTDETKQASEELIFVHNPLSTSCGFDRRMFSRRINEDESIELYAVRLWQLLNQLKY